MKGQCVRVFSRCCGRCEGFQVQWHQAVICTIQHFQCCCVWLGRAVLHAADRKCCTQFIPFFPFLSVRQRVLVTLLVWCEQSLCFLHTEVERKRGKWKRRKKKTPHHNKQQNTLPLFDFRVSAFSYWDQYQWTRVIASSSASFRVKCSGSFCADISSAFSNCVRNF